MRQHISKALVRRSTAIKSSLERYNKLAVKQEPPRPKLEYSDIATYCLLGEFELLKDSRYGVLTQAWSSPTNREITTKHFKVLCARAEITRLNVEIARLQDWIDKEDSHFQMVVLSLARSDPLLSGEIKLRYARQRRTNDVHRARLQTIYKLPGYSGYQPTPQDNKVVAQDLSMEEAVLIDEDDVLNDEGNRLDEAMDRMSILS
ncbi:hypothetical protein PHLCEN_2v3501 [Hermanssonia centrifuga]|uniref:Uncharacterized protein n=1 Tax=Hermanssonia centrifuga TaxID=98765 RepID=A0A2R6QF59_9APHY|nr:hypothetical protein PHLCEN_2v3501 [Hermanssonia centrifuga]